MRMNCQFRFMALALATVLVSSGTAHATDDSAKGAARDLANEAKRDFDKGNFEEAGLKFQRAFEIAKVPTLAVWAARALVMRGQMVAASELYRQATLLAPNDLWVGNTQQQAQADARKELGELQPRIPKLRISVEGAAAKDVELTVDDAEISTVLFGIVLPANPGRRHIVGKRGAEVVEQTVDLAEGERRDAVLRFAAVAPMFAQAPIALEVPPAPAPAVRQEAFPPAAPLFQPPAAEPVLPPPPSLADSGKPPAGDRAALDLRQKPATEEGGTASGASSHWWIWTAIGAVVAGGIVTAVILSSRNPGREGSCSSGVSGCLVVGK
jgi:hypothetical protein